jgi:hypothetical protein
MAVQYYPSRAFDAAGRPAGLERQILAPAPGAAQSIPPAALAFLLLPAAQKVDDTVWWDSWRDPRWSAMSHYLPIPEDEIKAEQLQNLDASFEQGLTELFDSVEADDLVAFYAQLLGGTRPAVLRIKTTVLSPLAMAALLLPLDRARTEELTIAGGVLSPSLDPDRLRNWDAVVCPPGVRVPEISIDQNFRLAASETVGILRKGLEHGGALPVSFSDGAKYLLGFLESDERWIRPGKLGAETLRELPTWHLVRNPNEATMLRARVQEFLDKVEQFSGNPPARMHLKSKADLVRALLLVLCPGEESLYLAGVPTTGLVPSLFFISRIVSSDCDELASHYSEEDFYSLALQSLRECKLQYMFQPVLDWLTAQAQGDSESLLAQRAQGVLRKYAATNSWAAPDSDPARV